MPATKPVGTARRRVLPGRAGFVSLAGIIVAGLMQVFRIASLAALVYAVGGPELRADGLALALIGTAIASVWIALRSSVPGVHASAQSVSVAVTVVAVSGAASAVRPGALDGTVLAVVAVSGVVTGLVLVVLGLTGAARLVRYLPHPVVGGVLAASGWVLVDSAIAMMSRGVAGGPFTPEAVLHWLPGIAIGVWLFVFAQAVRHPLVVPLTLLAAIARFFGVARLNGYSLTRLFDDGWLFGPLPEGALWRLPPVARWLEADLGVVIAQAPAYATVALVTALTALLFTSGLELDRDVDADAGRELRETGIANLLGATFAGLTATVSPTGSRLASAMRTRRRVDAAVTPLLTIVVLALGARVIGIVPLPVLGGLLVYLGAAYLSEWLVTGWRRLSLLDMAVVIVIVVTVAVFGLLEGVAVGLVVTVAMFVVAAARTDVVAAARSGRDLRSRVTRSAAARDRLWDEGERTAVFHLGGTVFFGTADRLVARAKERLAIEPLPRYVVLDVQDAATFDATGAFAVMRIARAAGRVGAEVVVAGGGPRLQRTLRKAGADATFAPDLDRALERCEDGLLTRPTCFRTVRPSTTSSQGSQGERRPGDRCGRGSTRCGWTPARRWCVRASRRTASGSWPRAVSAPFWSGTTARAYASRASFRVRCWASWASSIPRPAPPICWRTSRRACIAWTGRRGAHWRRSDPTPRSPSGTCCCASRPAACGTCPPRWPRLAAERGTRSAARRGGPPLSRRSGPRPACRSDRARPGGPGSRRPRGGPPRPPPSAR